MYVCIHIHICKCTNFNLCVLPDIASTFFMGLQERLTLYGAVLRRFMLTCTASWEVQGWENGLVEPPHNKLNKEVGVCMYVCMYV